MAPWRRKFVELYFPEYRFHYLSVSDHLSRHESSIRSAKDPRFFVWGMRQPESLTSFALQHGIPVTRLEDGFLRNTGSRSRKVAPHSLCLDETGIYFNAQGPSDLETLLESFDFGSDAELMQQADDCLQLIRERRITKYGEPASHLARRLYGSKRRARILIFGELEGDRVPAYGCEKRATPLELVALAAAEHPGAQLIYKAHPRTGLHGEGVQAELREISKLALVVTDSMSLDDALTDVDHVYTVTSLAGFEARLRGLPVTTLGAPFYAGWGLTDSRQATPRRTRTLQLREVFAGAYLKYARYFEPRTGAPLTLLDALHAVSRGTVAQAMVPPGAEALPPPADEPWVALIGFPRPRDWLRRLYPGSEVLVSDSLRTLMRRAAGGQSEDAIYVWQQPGSTAAPLPAAASQLRYRWVGPGVIHQLGLPTYPDAPQAWQVSGLDGDPSQLLECLARDPRLSDDALRQRASAQSARLLELVSRGSLMRVLPPGEPGEPCEPSERILVCSRSAAASPGGDDTPTARFTGVELLRVAALENPHAEILYLADPREVREASRALTTPWARCRVLPASTPLGPLLEASSAVYTSDDIAGFEAILRGRRVVVFGAPFYAGWGLTDDRATLTGRSRRLDAASLFLGACLLGATYADPVYKRFAEDAFAALDRALDRLEQEPLHSDPNAPRPSATAAGPAYVLGSFPDRKLLRAWFSDRRLTSIPQAMTVAEFITKHGAALERQHDTLFLIFPDTASDALRRHVEKKGYAVWYLDAGFLDALDPQAAASAPSSLLVDPFAPHHDGARASQLEARLSSHGLLATSTDPQAGTRLLEWLREQNPLTQPSSAPSEGGAPARRRVLVLGQEEGLVSSRAANPSDFSQDDLVAVAARENPGADVVYLPASADGASRLRASTECGGLPADTTLGQALSGVTQVYTVSSLRGLVALAHGIQTSVFGTPFYAGWGLTDDRLDFPRRQARLDLAELCSIAFGDYPSYLDPLYRTPSTLELELQRCERLRASPAPTGTTHDSERLWNELRLHEARGDFEAAFASASELVARADSATTRLKRAEMRLKKGEFGTATDEDFRAAIDLSGNTPQAIYRYYAYRWEIAPVSEALLRELDYQLSRVPEPLRKTKDYGRVLLLKAAMLFDAGNKSQALKLRRAGLELGAAETHYMAMRYWVRRAGQKSNLSGTDAATFEKILASKSRFKELVLEAGRSVCIVGNGPSLLGSGRGAAIDDHKLVIRFNNYSTDYPHSEDCGVKTDVWVRMPFHPYVKREAEPGLRLIVFTGSNKLSRPYSDWLSIFELVRDGFDVQFFDPEVVYDLQRKLGAPPTAGLVVCAMLYRIIGPLAPDNYCGFSFTEPAPSQQSYHYSDPLAAASSRHDWEREGEVFRSFLAAPAATLTPTRVQAFHSERRHSRPTTGMGSAATASGDSADVSYDRVISVSPGLGDYTLFGRKVELVSPGDAERHLDYVTSEGASGVCHPLLAAASTRNTALVGFGRARTGQLALRLAQALACEPRLVEYGLISSMHLPSDKQFNFSLVVDDTGIFYDTTRPSRIEHLLLHSERLSSPESAARAQAAIAHIRRDNITKYNHSADARLAPAQRRRILVIDQTANDLSISLGQCPADGFQNMLGAALEQPDTEVLLKLHPETVAGAKGGNLEALESFSSHPDLKVISEQCNIVSLIKQVDEVYVMTSGVGLEALMLGKTVRCFGVPFYAGWGLTQDVVPIRNPRRPRSVLELFAAVFFEYSVYFQPTTHEPCELEDCLAWISAHRPRLEPISVA